MYIRNILALFIFSSLLLSCSKKAAEILGESKTTTLSGAASLGPVTGGTVSIYKLNFNGTRGDLLKITTTNSKGTFSATIPANSGPVDVVISGGSYVEEASAQTVSLASQEIHAVINSTTADREVSITPLTDIAAKRVAALLSEGNSLASSISQANMAVAQAAGLSSGADVTALSPADPTTTLASQNINATSDRAKYALVLASLSQLASQNGINSINVTKAFGDDFKSDGSFNGKNNGVSLQFKDDSDTNIAPISADAWIMDLSVAASNYIAGAQNTAGFAVESRPVLQASPITGTTVITGVSNLTVHPKTFQAVAVQSDDKIVVGGSGVADVSGMSTFVLMRYLPDGTLDTTFGSGGRVATSFGGGKSGMAEDGTSSHILALAIDKTGKILAAGYTDSNVQGVHGLIARYNSNGSLDTSFGFNGVVRTQAVDTDFPNAMFNALTVQNDGKIIAVGQERLSQDSFSVWRFNTDGTPDLSFNSTGQYKENIIGGNCTATTVALQADGKILVGGNTIWGYGQMMVGVLRLNSNGTLDSSGFGGGGMGGGSLPSLLPMGFLNKIIVNDDGKILLIGSTGAGDGKIARILSNGALDTSYGTNGFADLSPDIFQRNTAAALTTYSGGPQIIIGGSPNGDFVSQKVNPDGTFVNSFGGNVGHPSMSFGNVTGDNDTVFVWDVLAAVGILSNGDYILVGHTEDYINGDSPNIEFYNANGTLKTSIGSNGAVHDKTAIVVSGAGEDKVNAMTTLSDGKMLVVGTTGTNGTDGTYASNDVFVIRYNADGSLDSTFGPDQNGKVVFDFQGNNSSDEGNDIALDANGKILIVGTTEVSGQKQMAISRLNANGSIDSTFGTNGNSHMGAAANVWGGKLLILPNGKIFVGGNSSDPVIPLWRLNSDGQFDTTYGPNHDGANPLTVGDISPNFTSMKLDNSENIILAGQGGLGSISGYTVVRLTPEGVLDSTFGTNGVTIISMNGSATAILVDSTAKLIIGGTYTDADNQSNYFAMIRLSSAGVLDTSFGTNGKVLAPVGDATQRASTILKNLSFDANSKIVAAGLGIHDLFDPYVTIARFNSNGAIDSSFGTSGMAAMVIGNSLDVTANGLTVKSTGDIFVAGSVNISNLRNSQIGTAGYDAYLLKYSP